MPEGNSTPPWGSDEQFNPARAWSLVTNLRDEVDSLKAERASLTSERDALATERDRLQVEMQAAQTAQKAAESARRLDKIKAEHGISDEDAEEFLSGDLTEAELRRKAERLAARNPAPAAPKDGDGDGAGTDGDESGDPADDGDNDGSDADNGDPIPGRPQAALTPGQGTDGEPATDEDKVVSDLLSLRGGAI